MISTTLGINLLVFVVSFYFLIKFSDHFVEYASKIAKHLGISEFIIGLTLVSIGTSLPELSASISASLLKDSEIVVGNIFGSNIANIGLVLGVAVILHTFRDDREMFDRDGFLMLFVTSLILIFALDRTISAFEGVILISIFGYYMYELSKIRKKKEVVFEEIEEEHHPYRYSAIAIFSGAVIFVSARFLIISAETIASNLGISQTIIGVTAIAIGTSIPELAVSIQAARKGLANLLLGNVIGSNIANITLIGGVSAIINPLHVDTIAFYFIIPFLLMFSFLFLFFMRTQWKLDRREGILLCSSYLIFITFLVVFSVI